METAKQALSKISKEELDNVQSQYLDRNLRLGIRTITVRTMVNSVSKTVTLELKNFDNYDKMLETARSIRDMYYFQCDNTTGIKHITIKVDKKGVVRLSVNVTAGTSRHTKALVISTIEKYEPALEELVEYVTGLTGLNYNTSLPVDRGLDYLRTHPTSITLRIYLVTKEDGGKYICNVHSDDDIKHLVNTPYTSTYLGTASKDKVFGIFSI